MTSKSARPAGSLGPSAPEARNPYESGARKVIPAVLIYLTQGDEVLMIHRKSRTPGREDFHEGRWNGLGGKLEADESPLEAGRRELREEAGIDLDESRFQVVGLVQFPNFKPHRSEDWSVYVLRADLTPKDADPRWTENSEGDLHWVRKGELLKLNLWPGDRLFIPFVVGDLRKAFFGTIWYRNGQVDRHWIQS